MTDSLKPSETQPVKPMGKPAEKTTMSGRDWLAVMGGALGAFMAILDIQVTNASLREISGALSLDISESSWISTAYLIAEIIVIPLTAFLSQVFGNKRYLIWNCLGFLAASVACGLSWSLGSMIFFRALQGFTGGTLIPMSFQLILNLMPNKLKPLGLTIFGLTVTLAPTLGPTLGGWLTDEYGWRSIFFLNIIPGIFMTLAMRIGLDSSPMDLKKLKNLDLLSLATLVLGLSSFTYMLEEGPKVDWFQADSMRYCLLTMIVCLPLFVIRQLELEDPLLHLRLFLNRNFALGTIITAIAGCALFSGIYGLSLYLGQVQDYSAAQIGQVLMWVGLPQLLVMPLLPVLMRYIDLRLLALAGMLLFAYSNFMNAGIDANFGGEHFRNSLLLRAFGQPLFVIPLSSMAMGLIKHEESGDASSIFNVMRNLGASLGIAMTSTLLMAQQAVHLNQNASLISGYDYHVVETLYSTEMKLRGLGLDAAGAKAHAFRQVMADPIKNSVIQAFGDLFAVLTWGLLLSCVLILFFIKTKPFDDPNQSVGH